MRPLARQIKFDALAKSTRPGWRHLTIAEIFWSHVDKSGAHWIWVGSRNENGYGTFAVDGRSMLAHRVAWFIQHGSIPPDLDVLHKPPCALPPCVRHLYLGTHLKNMDDRRAAQTHCKRGHLRTSNNTIERMGQNGYVQRHCSECAAERSKERTASGWWKSNAYRKSKEAT